MFEHLVDGHPFSPPVNFGDDVRGTVGHDSGELAQDLPVCPIGTVNPQIPENRFANKLTGLLRDVEPLFACEGSEDGKH